MSSDIRTWRVPRSCMEPRKEASRRSRPRSKGRVRGCFTNRESTTKFAALGTGMPAVWSERLRPQLEVRSQHRVLSIAAHCLRRFRANSIRRAPVIGHISSPTVSVVPIPTLAKVGDGAVRESVPASRGRWALVQIGRELRPDAVSARGRACSGLPPLGRGGSPEQAPTRP